MAEIKVEALVDGGSATPGPPLGPALGPTGANVVKVVQEINQKTAAFKGMKVPVIVRVNADDKSFTVSVGTPPTSALLLKEAGAEKGSGKPKQEKIGDITVGQVVKVAKMKADDLQGATLKKRVKEVAGTANSCGITVEGKPAPEFQREVDEGVYDDKIKE